jgi:hypothetical protein
MCEQVLNEFLAEIRVRLFFHPYRIYSNGMYRNKYMIKIYLIFIALQSFLIIHHSQTNPGAVDFASLTDKVVPFCMSDGMPPRISV